MKDKDACRATGHGVQSRTQLSDPTARGGAGAAGLDRELEGEPAHGQAGPPTLGAGAGGLERELEGEPAHGQARLPTPPARETAAAHTHRKDEGHSL